ncbi:MAG: LicD family protein [Lachnospiraceae bacterium]|nr:LicD family protein [Lachnospiraceae bacterium]
MIFDKDFFKEEVRNNFLIPELMKRAWAAELEVLQVVTEICIRHDIPYFAEWGTLLGTVRHQGFIPWDDDIDISLKRPDYNRLISCLRTDLPPGFVMPGMYARKEELQSAAQIPNIRVMADETYWDFSGYLKRFHAFPFFRIGIDIFPLDYMPRDPELFNWQKIIMQQIYLLLINDENNCTGFDYNAQLQGIEALCGVTLRRDSSLKNSLWKLYDSISSLYTYEDADYITGYHFWIDMPQYIQPKECFDEFIMLPFENISIPVPKRYDEVLTAEYGDYKTPSREGADHTYPFYARQEQALTEIFKQQGITQSITEFCRNFANQHHCDS